MAEISTIADLTLDPKNARRRGPRATGMLEASLQEVGAARSIVIDEAGRILAGNGTVEAAGQVGIERVKVVDADGEELVAVRRRGLTEAQKRRLAVLDNRTGELAEWDAQVIAELAADGLELDDLWAQDELDALLADGDLDLTHEPDESDSKGLRQLAVLLTPPQFDFVEARLSQAADDGCKTDPENPHRLGNALWALLSDG